MRVRARFLNLATWEWNAFFFLLKRGVGLKFRLQVVVKYTCITTVKIKYPMLKVRSRKEAPRLKFWNIKVCYLLTSCLETSNPNIGEIHQHAVAYWIVNYSDMIEWFGVFVLLFVCLSCRKKELLTHKILQTDMVDLVMAYNNCSSQFYKIVSVKPGPLTTATNVIL